MEMSFSDKVVIVTGAGRGIGRAIAYAYAEQGAKVVIADKTKHDVEETVRSMQERDTETLGITVDLRKPNEILTLVEKNHWKI